jgi:uncharacterized protein
MGSARVSAPGMLRQTFLHVPGVGYSTEERLWRAGVHGWDDVSAGRHGRILSGRIARRLEEWIGASESALRKGRYRYFAENLPPREHWRAWPDFRDHAAYVDIETTGLDIGRDALTVVGVFDGHRTKSFVKGRNLEELPGAIEGRKLLVTFNGARFDLPFLRRAFPRMRLDQIHVDVMGPLRRLGFHGGLKRIEARLGIERSALTTGMNGFEAVRLWHDYEAGDDDALDSLLEYNREDCVNLKPLANFAYEGLRSISLDYGFVTADHFDPRSPAY